MVNLLVPDFVSGGCCRDFEKNHRPDIGGENPLLIEKLHLWSPAVPSVGAAARALSFADRAEQEIGCLK
jgi:hypothetical protein